MQPRGTQVLMGKEFVAVWAVESSLCSMAYKLGFEEIRLPNIWSASTFLANDKLKDTMYLFKDKGDRDLCLVPEATAMIVELYNGGWNKSMKKPVKLSYLQRCYRYDRPQAGRYREFTQFGVEVLGSKDAYDIVLHFAKELIEMSEGQLKLIENPERGLHYYTGRTFEVVCEGLGAQKQVIGGGEYADGAGFALGVERFVMMGEL